jgi:hypothetical protein
MIPVGLIVRLVGILMVFAAIGYAVYRVQHWCNTACEQQTLRAEDSNQAEAARKLDRDSYLLWAAQVDPTHSSRGERVKS